MKAYDVTLNGRYVDTVFWVNNSDADEVRRSLIDHDGYDQDIVVTHKDKRGYVIDRAPQ
jgi:hypothetical protein